MPPKKLVTFYDGVAVAENGLLTIPVEKRTWWERAWRLLGYNLTPEGSPLFSLQDLEAEVSRQTAESAEGKNESPNRRRQPAT